MKFIRCGLLVLLVCCVGACHFPGGVGGSGTIKTESRPVSGFTSVEVHGSAKLIIEQGDMESLSITADDNLLQHLTSEVQGSKLTLGPRVSISPTAAITYKLSVKKLNVIAVSGEVAVDATGIRTDSLAVALSGAGNVSISGEAPAQKVAISGIGEYKAENFKTGDTTIAISGSGKAIVAAYDRLDVQVSGAGDVQYIGNPEIKQSISGLGTVKAWKP